MLITVEVRADSPRLDLLLLAALQLRQRSISRAALKKLFQQGRVLFHGRPAAASEQLAVGSHEITLRDFGDPGLAEGSVASAMIATAAAECFLPVIYEDENLLILHKLSGIPSVPHAPDETRTAVGAALAHFPALSQVGRRGLEPGILHRLDTGTSGILVFAKQEAEFGRLSEAWKNGQVKKFYRALARKPEAELRLPLRLDFPLARDGDSSKRMVALNRPTRTAIRGKPLAAVTEILAVREIFCRPNEAPHADFEIQIFTGVMHQIRCQLAAMGWPLLGDAIYRGAPAERLWLHAWRLHLPMGSGEWLKVEARLPEGWGS
jgi:23S rRNA pseudouridine1911/1915/1917 synthase